VSPEYVTNDAAVVSVWPYPYLTSHYKAFLKNDKISGEIGALPVTIILTFPPNNPLTLMLLFYFSTIPLHNG
jgi:hypothetical protein